MRQQAQDDLSSRLKSFAATQAAALTAPVWEFDQAGIERITATYARMDEMLSARLSGADGAVLAQIGAPPSIPYRNVETVRLPLIREAEGNRFEIGALEISFHDAKLQQQMQSRHQQDVITLSVLFCLLAASLVTAMHFQVRLPLERLHRSLTRREKLNWSSRDELGEVAQAYNQLLSQQAQAETQILTYQNNLERQVENRTNELRISEQRFKDFAQSSSDWFWESDADHRFTRFFGNSETLLYLNAGNALIGRTRLDMLSATVSPEVALAHQADLDRRRPFRDLIYDVEISPEQFRTLNVAGRPVFDANRQFTGYRGTCCDITDRIKAERRIYAAEARLLGAISAISDAIALFDPDDCLVLANSRFQTLFPGHKNAVEDGKTFDELILQSVRDGVYALPPDSRDEWVALRIQAHARADGEPQVAATGDGRWICASEYRTPDGGIVGLYSDITETVVKDLELRASKHAAEEANRAKSEFLANMSHEIRTPMNAVIGLSHLALQTNQDHRQRDYLTKINASAKSLLGIINDILDFSKIEANKMSLESIDFQLEQVLENLASAVSIKACEKNLELIFAIEPDVPALVGDPVRLNQILLNLVFNAIKFTEQGEVKVTCHVQDVDGDTIMLHCAISDTGIGMTSEQIARLFTAFTQADNTITRRFGGTGLGLTICHRLVEIMGGQIEVQSVFGQGATFTFSIPFRISRGELSAKAALPPPSCLMGLPVLVVDDNPASLTILKHYLDSFGCATISAESGIQALALMDAAPQPFALVVTDWRMPDMDGVELVRRIRARPVQPSPHIILVSAYDSDRIGSLAAELETGMLTKPVSPAPFLEEICRTLGEGMSEIQDIPPTVVTTRTLQGKRILLVEDNDMNQMVAEELLCQQGAQVVIANHGREALEALEKHHFDGVLMDVMMPVMDGYSATRHIRADPRFSDLPIIAMTANAMSGDREQALTSGMNDHIPKPIDVKEMFDVLTRWL